MTDFKFARRCGLFCIAGAFLAFLWGILNSFYPNSTGSTVNNNFVVLIPWLHRAEHAFFAFFIYPALYAGLLGFYLIGGIGRGIIGKLLIGLATIGVILAITSSAIEVFLLQWETADSMRDIGLGLILVFICPVLFTAAALFMRKVVLWKRFAPVLTFVITLAFLFISAPFDKKFVPFFTGLGILSWSLLGYAVVSENETRGLSSEEIELNRLSNADQ
jgi:hypothetical protein